MGTMSYVYNFIDINTIFLNKHRKFSEKWEARKKWNGKRQNLNKFEINIYVSRRVHALNVLKISFDTCRKYKFIHYFKFFTEYLITPSK